MLHHAPQDGAASAKRALSDRKELQDMLKRTPVNLVLHGHLHYPVRATLDGPSGPVPVLGAASASAIGKRKAAAHYHIIEIDAEEKPLKIKVSQCHYDTSAGIFSVSETQSI